MAEKKRSRGEDRQPQESEPEDIIEALSERLRQRERDLEKVMSTLETLKKEVSDLKTSQELLKSSIGGGGELPKSRTQGPSAGADSALQAVNSLLQTLGDRISRCTSFDAVNACALNMQKGLIAIATKDGTVHSGEISSQKELLSLSEKKCTISNLAFSHDGRLLAYICPPGSIGFYDLKTHNEIEETSKFKSTISAISFHPLKSLLAVGSDEGEVTLFDFFRSKSNSSRPTNVSISSMAFGRDGQAVVTGHPDGTLNLVSVPAMKIEKSAGEHKAAVSCLCVLQKENWLASGSTDGTIIIWSLPELAPKKIFHESSGAIRALDFVKDQPYLCSIARDGSIRSWAL